MMQMTQISTMPGWTFSQLNKLRKQQPELVDSALADMMKSNQELRWSLVLTAYLDEEINLGKAAELLELSELELRERFIELGVPLRLGPTDLVEAQAEANAFRAWLVDK